MPIPPLINWVHIATDPSQQLPESYVHWMRTCAKTNTDLTLLFWSAADCAALVAARYPSFSSFYHSELKTSIYKADFCRMLVLHAVGGIYLDLDFYCIRPLSPLLSHSLFVAEVCAHPALSRRRSRMRTDACGADLGVGAHRAQAPLAQHHPARLPLHLERRHRLGAKSLLLAAPARFLRGRMPPQVQDEPTVQDGAARVLRRLDARAHARAAR